MLPHVNGICLCNCCRGPLINRACQIATNPTITNLVTQILINAPIAVDILDHFEMQDDDTQMRLDSLLIYDSNLFYVFERNQIYNHLERGDPLIHDTRSRLTLHLHDINLFDPAHSHYLVSQPNLQQFNSIITEHFNPDTTDEIDYDSIPVPPYSPEIPFDEQMDFQTYPGQHRINYIHGLTLNELNYWEEPHSQFINSQLNENTSQENIPSYDDSAPPDYNYLHPDYDYPDYESDPTGLPYYE